MLKYNILFLCMALPLVISCGKSNDLSWKLEQMCSCPISIPWDEMDCVGGRNEVEDRMRLLTLVVYSDSLSCSLCQLSKIHFWNDILNEVDKYGDRMAVRFIFNPKKEDRQSVEFAIRTTNFNGTVYVDSTGVLMKQNTCIPVERMFHTFLLDENNNVLLVGNPLENEKIEEMFWQIVEEKLGKRE